MPMDISYAVNGGAVTITGYTGTNSFLSIPKAISNMPVTQIGTNAFLNRSHLTSVVLPETLTDIHIDAFCGCTRLSNITIPSKVVYISHGAFYSNTSLTHIDIPDSVTNIGWAAFMYCSSLTNVTLGSGLNTLYGRAFAFCPLLTSIDVSDQSPLLRSIEGVLIGKSYDGVSWSTDFDYLVICPEGKGNSYNVPIGVRKIGIEAFHYCLGLTNLFIPSSVSRIYDGAIASCSNLTAIYFSGDAPSYYSHAFDGYNPATIYYYPWTSGWTDTYDGRPTAINPAYSQWLTNYGFTTNLIDDDDHDGMLNWQEYLAGTSPTNDADKLIITPVSNSSFISWLAKSNVSYQVMKNWDLMGAWSNAPSGTGTNQQAFKTAPQDGLMQYTDPSYPSSSNAFYRVNVVP